MAADAAVGAHHGVCSSADHDLETLFDVQHSTISLSSSAAAAACDVVGW